MNKKDKIKQNNDKNAMPEPDAFVNTHAISCFGKTSNIDLQTPISERG